MGALTLAFTVKPDERLDHQAMAIRTPMTLKGIIKHSLQVLGL